MGPPSLSQQVRQGRYPLCHPGRRRGLPTPEVFDEPLDAILQDSEVGRIDGHDRTLLGAELGGPIASAPPPPVEEEDQNEPHEPGRPNPMPAPPRGHFGAPRAN